MIDLACVVLLFSSSKRGPDTILSAFSRLTVPPKSLKKYYHLSPLRSQHVAWINHFSCTQFKTLHYGHLELEGKLKKFLHILSSAFVQTTVLYIFPYQI